MSPEEPNRDDTAQVDSTRLWELLVGDSATGAATRPVGVLGVAGDAHHVSWLPLEPAADLWRQRLTVDSTVPMGERAAFWAEHCNGVTIDLAAFEADPASRGLRDAVERAVDDLLVATAILLCQAAVARHGVGSVRAWWSARRRL